ncbi:MAG: hypothetical protein KatS3mg131_3711 [Candidatus Tectimicrobiota bacterium]|nr:MAG: hypothetical protein KatS3mg131_3711 [Candidatus Tectomicrobia bacterium]
MSVINQALKKAQREQLWSGARPLPLPLPPVAGTPPRRRWRWLVLGLPVVTAVGLWLSLRLVPGEASRALPGAWRLAPVAPPPATSPPLPAAAAASGTAAAVPGGERAEQLARMGVPDAEAAGTTAAVPAAPLTRRAPERRVAPAAVPRQEASDTARAQARALFNQAVEALEAEVWPQAHRLLQQAVALAPDFKEAYTSLGNLYYRQQQYQQAIAMYEKALALDPAYVKARNNLGSAYLRLAKYDQAIAAFEQALQADRTFSLPYYNLACVYARQGDSGTAARYLRQAIALEPQARQWAQRDEDFRQVRAAPEIQQLLRP